MKRIYVLAALCALIFGAQLLVTCSNPIELDDDPDPSPPIIDTVIDTLIDTVEVFDTDTIFDTLEIVVPDSTCIQTICDTLSNYNQMIFWTFGNMAGTYLLTFEATVENNQPPKELIVTIDGEEYFWHTDQSLVFTVEATLDDYSTIKIHPDKPVAFGHYIYVCLTFGTP